MEIIKAELIQNRNITISEKTDSYLQKALKFYSDQKYDSVLVYCHKSYAVDSENWKLFYVYGLASYQTGHSKLAAEYYYRALSFCKNKSADRAKLYYALAENEDAVGNYAKATQQYLMVIQLDNNSELAKSARQKMQYLTKTE